MKNMAIDKKKKKLKKRQKLVIFYVDSSTKSRARK